MMLHPPIRDAESDWPRELPGRAPGVAGDNVGQGGPARSGADADRDAVSLLIVHRSEVVGEGLRLALGRWPGLRVVGAVSTAPGAVAAAERRWPDMVFVDAVVGGVDGAQIAADIRRVARNARVILFAPHGDQQLLRRGRAAGVAGYLRMGATRETMSRALATVAVGQEFIDPDLAAGMLDPASAPITARELEVLQLMADGLSNCRIAERLTIGEETVKTHAQRIHAKLDARCRAHAVAIGLRRGLVH